MNSRKSRAERFYRFLLRMFPFDFRREYGAEMEDCFHEESAGLHASALWWRTVAGFLRAAPAQHLDVFRRDLRQALRSFQRNPLMALIAVSVLALGIGANTALFSEVNLMLIRPLPVVAPERVARVLTPSPTGDVRYEQYLQFREQNRTFLQLAAFHDRAITFRFEGPPESTVATLITGNYFNALPAPPLIGRMITETDNRPGAVPVAMLSEEFWRSRFGADPLVTGRTLTINGIHLTIVGVTPGWFGGADRDTSRDLWIPWNALPPEENVGVNMVGRLRDGVSFRQAESDLSVIARQLRDPRSQHPLTVMVRTAHLVPPILSRQVVPLFAFFIVLAILSMTIPCLNIGSLFLAQAAERRREMGIRIALGAGRGQLLRELLTESFVVAIIACIAGLFVFAATLGVFVARFEVSQTYATRLIVDWRVAVFAVGLSVVTTILAGLAPALHASSTEVVSALKDVESAGTHRSRLRALFIVGQVAVSALLLAMSALFVRSLNNSRFMDLGFDPKGIATARVSLDSAHYSAQQGSRFYQNLLQDLENSPALASVNIAAFDGPLGPGAAKMRAVGLEQVSSYAVFVVSRGHFKTLGIPMIAGRDFDASDERNGERVGIVNEALAQHQWPGQTPIEKDLDGIEIIGVVRGTNYFSNSSTPQQFLYLPLGGNYTSSVLLLMKPNGNRSHALSIVADVVARLDHEVSLADQGSLTELADLSLRPVRIVAAAAGILGTLALGLATIGIYGTVAFLARQRTREIGIRIALGAPRSRIAQLITGETLRWAFVGLLVGFSLAALTARAVKGLMFGVTATDPLTFVTVSFLLGSVAFLASWLPARRAIRIDPMTALRQD